MAARKRTSIRTTTRSTTVSKRDGGGAGRYVLPAVALAAIGAYLLWPRLARAGTTPGQIVPPPTPTPNQLPPPTPTGPAVEPVADAALPAGARLARIIGSNDVPLNVRAGPGTNTAVVSRLPRGAGVAIIDGGEASAQAGPGSQLGWWRIRTSRGINGYVAQEFLDFVGGNTLAAGWWPSTGQAAPPAAPGLAPVRRSAPTSYSAEEWLDQLRRAIRNGQSEKIITNLHQLYVDAAQAAGQLVFALPLNTIYAQEIGWTPPGGAPPMPSWRDVEPVADAPLPPGARLARLTAYTNVRSAPNETTPIVSLLPTGAGVAIIHAGPPSPPTPAAPQGWWLVRTSRGINGYVAAQFLQFIPTALQAAG